MNFKLPMDENGIVVELKDVDEADEQKLKAAKSNILNPTDEPFNKYFSYDKEIGFFVGRDHFDHAEFKGKILSYDEYLKKYEQTKEVETVEHPVDTITEVKRINDSKEAYEEMLQRAKDDCVELKRLISDRSSDDKDDILSRQMSENKILTKYASSLSRQHDDLDEWIAKHSSYLEKLHASTHDSIDESKILTLLTNIDSQIKNTDDINKLLDLSNDAKAVMKYSKNVKTLRYSSDIVDKLIDIQGDLYVKIKAKLLEMKTINSIDNNANEIFQFAKSLQDEF